MRMGLFGGSPEKIEAKGDAALAHGEAMQAYQHFRDALRRLGGKDAAALERLRAKIARAHAAFVESKLAEAEGYLADHIVDPALETLAILGDHLAEGGEALADRVRALEARAQAMRELDAPTTPAAPREADEVPLALGGVLQEEDESLELESIPADADPRELFEQFSGALAPEDLERAEGLGEKFRLGFVAQQLGKLPSAYIELMQAAVEHPTEPLVLEHLAVVLDQLGLAPAAEEHYRRALEIDPKRMNARLALAAMLGHLGPIDPDHPEQPPAPPRDSAGAIALLEEGLRLDPSRALNYLMSLVEVALAAREFPRAVEWAKQGLAAGGEPLPDAWMLYGFALEAAGDLDEAQAAFVKAVRLGGAAMQPRARLAEFALRTGQGLEKAQEIIFETCMSCQAAAPDPGTLAYYGFLLSRIQFARGRYKDALDGAQRLLKQGPPEAMGKQMQALIRDARAAIETAKRRREEPEPADEGEAGDKDEK
jgi:tetratricopeptide (TPR) repeat protein